MYLLLQFTNWKTSLENSTTGSFIKHDGEKLRNNKKYLNFYCNRSWQSRNRNKTNNTKLRASKSQGTAFSVLVRTEKVNHYFGCPK